MTSLADKLAPPYYAAIIENEDLKSETSDQSPSDRLVSLAVRRPGFLGLETARSVDGRPLTVAYWRDMTDVEGWTMAGQAVDPSPLRLEIKKIAKSADAAVRSLYVVPDETSFGARFS